MAGGGGVRGFAAGAAGDAGGATAGRGAAGTPVTFWIHSRMRASSSGASPANRTCASGPARATNPQHSNVAHDNRTVSPAWNGSADDAWTPAVVTVACSSGTRLPRDPTCPVAGEPRSGEYVRSTADASRVTHW